MGKASGNNANPAGKCLKAEPGSYTLTVYVAKLTKTVTKAMWKKNPWLIVTYFAVQTAGIIASYWTNEWMSVGLSFVVAVITFFVGIVMLIKVVTITREIN